MNSSVQQSGKVTPGNLVSWTTDGVVQDSGIVHNGGPFLPIAGGQMLGPILLSENPVQSTEAATKAYVDAVAGGGTGVFLPLAGGQMTGNLLLNTDPTQPTQAATKHYVDTQIVGGPYLPLAGGTVTGATTFTGGLTTNGGIATFDNQVTGPTASFGGSNVVTLTNANPTAWLNMNGFIQGSPSISTGAFKLTASDIMTPTGPVARIFSINHAVAPNGHTASGNRITFGVTQTLVGAAQGGSYTNNDTNQVAQFTHFSECNSGGTSLLYAGNSTSLGVTSSLLNGSTFHLGNAAAEFDTATATGASLFGENSFLIVHTSNHQVQALTEDNAILIGDQIGAGAGRKAGIVFGSGSSQWPLDVTVGAMIQARLGNHYNTNPSSARYGFDAQQAGFPAFNTTSRGGFLVSNGFAVDGVGAVQIGSTYLTSSSDGMAIDTKGIIGFGTPTVAAGGTGYTNGDILLDPFGGVYIATVSAGVVTSVAVFTDGNGNNRQPLYPSSSPPSNPVTTTSWFPSNVNFPGSGCTLNLSWNTSATTLSIQPSGGTTTFGGPVTLPSGTTGPFLPLTGGTLSGPGNLIANGSISANGAGQFNATLGVTGLCAFNFPTVNDFFIERTGGFRTLQWSATDSLSWTESSGLISFVHSSTVNLTLDTSGNLFVLGGIANNGGITSNGVLQVNSTAGFTGLVAFAYPTVTDFLIQRAGGFRSLQWSATDSLSWTESTGITSFVHSSTVNFSIDASGNAAANGNITAVGNISTTSGALSAGGGVTAGTFARLGGTTNFDYPSVTDFFIERTGGFRTLQWSSAGSFTWTESTSTTSIIVSSTVMFSVDGSGNMAINGANASKPSGSASWIITSDERVKRNIRPYTAGLKEVVGLRPIVFEYNGEHGTPDDGAEYIGLSAQATKPVMSEMVVNMPNKDDLLGVDTGPLNLAMINAIRELSERVKALEAR